ncbi:T9SS type A sorting domain-containing protein [bacterium]|nr:T9SS type A sorting domain-containing protein [bacterium]
MRLKRINGMLILSLLVLVLAAGLQAQNYIGIVNPSFELPGTAKQSAWDNAGADDVPGWTSDTPATDSGVESTGIATDGTWNGFIKGGDDRVYQITGHMIVPGDDITLFVDAKNTGSATLFEISFFSVDTLGETAVLANTQVNVTDEMATYSLNFKSADYPEALGKLLGIAFDNVGIEDCWIGLDHVRAINKSMEIDVANYSFEEPALGKIKGWDEEDGAYIVDTSEPAEIPGWDSDDIIVDSGVELGWTPTDGIYTAFMMSQDTSMYQLTNYVIMAGDDIELLVDARITWAALFFTMALYYDDGGNRALINYEEYELLETYDVYSVSFKADNYPDCIGHRLGIEFDNISDPDSWIGLDFVRLTNYNVNDVAGAAALPDGFALDQNYPNPFNPETTIRYSLPAPGDVTLEIFDLRGQKIRTLADRSEQAGVHEIRWNAVNESGVRVPSGVYLCRLHVRASGKTDVQTRKLVLMK